MKSKQGDHKMNNSKKILPETINCPNCGEELEIEETERREKKFICPECNNSIDIVKYIRDIVELLDKYLPMSTLKGAIYDLLNTNYVIYHAFINAKKLFTATTYQNYEIIYHLVRNILREGLSTKVHADSWQTSIAGSESGTLIAQESDKMIPPCLDLYNECEELVKEICFVAKEKQKQLEDDFVFCIEYANYQVTPKTFFMGDIYFTRSSIIFIPYEEEFEFDYFFTNKEETVKLISQRLGGLAAQAPAYKIRADVTKSVGHKKQIQFGMNILQKFLNNIDSINVEKNENDGFLFIDKAILKNINIKEGVLSINTNNDTILFGSMVIRLAEEECNDNLKNWLSEDYSKVSESCFISKIIAPKVLLDGLVAQKQYSSELMEEFMKDERHTLLFFKLFKGLPEESKKKVLNHTANLSKSLYNKLMDDEFMSQITPLKEHVSGDCFIATVIYEDSNAEPVQFLRKFRDEILINSLWGNKFVEQYYIWSPPIASYLADKQVLKKMAEYLLLRPFIGLLKILRSRKNI